MSRISNKVVAHLRNKATMACKDMADVCELAHKRTVAECKKKRIKVDMYDEDGGPISDSDVFRNEDGDEVEQTYTPRAQKIFDRHYDQIIEATGL